MREIKFRLRIKGKVVGYEKWVGTGWYYKPLNDVWSTKYIPHTNKDQFTGQRDSETEKEIYEGDTVRNQDGEEVLIGKVVWDVDTFIVRLPKQMEVDEGVNANFVQLGYKDWEIIGNVF